MAADDDNSKVPGPPRKAVALSYGGRGTTPRITAKGAGEIAEQIMEIAREHGVHLHEDKALATALGQIPLGDEIPESLYIAVAEVLAFVYFLSGRVPGMEKPEGG